MNEDFVVYEKGSGKNEDKSVIMTIRLDRVLQEEFDKLAQKSKRSRNELIGMALRYALEHLKFIPEEKSPSEN